MSKWVWVRWREARETSEAVVVQRVESRQTLRDVADVTLRLLAWTERLEMALEDIEKDTEV